MKKDNDMLTNKPMFGQVFQVFVYLLVFLLIQLVSPLIVTTAYTLICGHPAESLPLWVRIAGLVLYSLLTIIVFVRLKWFEPSTGYMRSRPWGVLLWCVVAALGVIVPSLFLQQLLPSWPEWAQELVDQTEADMVNIMRHPAGYIVIALLPPVVEELVFRGTILRTLLTWKPQSPWLMIAVTSLLFALVHVNPAQMPHAFAVGLLLGWMYRRTGSIVPGVAFHWANNSAAYVMFHVYHNPQTIEDMVGPGPRVYMALAFSLCMLLPALYQLSQRMKPVR